MYLQNDTISNKLQQILKESIATYDFIDKFHELIQSSDQIYLERTNQLINKSQSISFPMQIGISAIVELALIVLKDPEKNYYHQY